MPWAAETSSAAFFWRLLIRSGSIDRPVADALANDRQQASLAIYAQRHPNGCSGICPG
jgi:hypothetical protein